MQVAPVQYAIGCAMPGGDIASERERRQLFSGEAIHDADALGPGDFPFKEGCHTKRLENAHAVRADLNAGAFFGAFSALFEDGDGAAGAGECERCSQPGDAGASYHNFGVSGWPVRGAVCHHARRVRSGCGVEVADEAALGVCLVFAEAGIIDKEGRAVGAQDLPIRAHVEKDVRMIERRAGAHAVQFLDADEDFFRALVVREVGNEVCGHGSLSAR